MEKKKKTTETENDEMIMQTGEEEQQAPQERSKDDLQRELAAMKADFVHTPMQMTPELEELLAKDGIYAGLEHSQELS